MLTDGNSSRRVIESLVKTKLLNEGSGLILGSFGFWEADQNGILTFAEDQLEESTDKYEYESYSIIKFLKIMLNCEFVDDSELLRDYLESLTDNHHAKSDFLLLNVQNNLKVRVGNINKSQISIQKPIIYPGNLLEKPNSPRTDIRLSIADGSTNPGYGNSAYSDLIKQGAYYAIKLAESQNYLENYDVKVTHTDCGAEVYNSTFMNSCFKTLKNDLGVAHMTSPFLITCFGTANEFLNLNISIPIISEYCRTPTTSNKAKYPNLIKLIKDIRFQIAPIVSFINILN